MSKILLLGSGELGKEFVIAAKRLGQYEEAHRLSPWVRRWGCRSQLESYTK